MINRHIQISLIGIRAFPSDFPGTSGAEVYTEMVIRSIIKADPSIRFYIYTKKNYPSRAPNTDAISVCPVFTFPSRTMETPIYSFLASYKAAFDRSSLVWYQSIGSAMFCWIPMMLGKRIVITLHGLDWQRKKWSWIERVVFSRIAYVLLSLNVSLCGVSETLCALVQKKIGKPVIYVPPGLSPMYRRTDRNRLGYWHLLPYWYLLYVGRLVPEKRIELLIHAWRKLHRTMPALHLVIAGGHGNFPAYENRLKKRFTDPDIHWTGYVFGKDKAALLSYCACFVLPSEIEGAPISVLEALQYKVPCVVTKNIVPKSLTHLHNVFVFNNSKKESLEQSIRTVIKNQERLRGEYSPGGKRILRSFSWRQTAHIYHRLFASLIERTDNHVSKK